jgi:hypothetical protein
VDRQGNVYASGPGGLWILSPEGKHLGTIVGPEHPHNFAWGDADGRTLYLCARTGLYRIRLGVAGVRPADGIESSARIQPLQSTWVARGWRAYFEATRVKPLTAAAISAGEAR